MTDYEFLPGGLYFGEDLKLIKKTEEKIEAWQRGCQVLLDDLHGRLLKLEESFQNISDFVREMRAENADIGMKN